VSRATHAPYDVAEDATSEVVVKHWLRPGLYSPGRGSLLDYFFICISNRCRDKLKHDRRRAAHEVADGTDPAFLAGAASETPESRFLGNERRKTWAARLFEVANDDNERRVLHLLCLEAPDDLVAKALAYAQPIDREEFQVTLTRFVKMLRARARRTKDELAETTGD
jgi:DNA-directed RNA polymerase specialized sigma24 family protein